MICVILIAFAWEENASPTPPEDNVKHWNACKHIVMHSMATANTFPHQGLNVMTDLITLRTTLVHSQIVALALTKLARTLTFVPMMYWTSLEFVFISQII